MVVAVALKEAEWRMPTEDYGVILIYDLPIEVQRELYPQLEFDEDGYRYRVRAVYVSSCQGRSPGTGHAAGSLIRLAWRLLL